MPYKDKNKKRQYDREYKRKLAEKAKAELKKFDLNALIKDEPEKHEGIPFPSWQNMLENSGQDKRGFVLVCPVCGTELNKEGVCPHGCTIADFYA